MFKVLGFRVLGFLILGLRVHVLATGRRACGLWAAIGARRTAVLGSHVSYSLNSLKGVI